MGALIQAAAEKPKDENPAGGAIINAIGNLKDNPTGKSDVPEGQVEEDESENAHKLRDLGVKVPPKGVWSEEKMKHMLEEKMKTEKKLKELRETRALLEDKAALTQ